MFRKYVILQKVLGGHMCVPYREYKRNELFQMHPIIDIGTKRKLRKMWNV